MYSYRGCKVKWVSGLENQKELTAGSKTDLLFLVFAVEGDEKGCRTKPRNSESYSPRARRDGKRTQVLVDCPFIQIVLKLGLNGAVKVVESYIT